MWCTENMGSIDSCRGNSAASFKNGACDKTSHKSIQQQQHHNNKTKIKQLFALYN